MAFLTEIPKITDLNTALKAKKQYWSIEWTFQDSKKKNHIFRLPTGGTPGGVLGLICVKIGVFDGNTQDNRPKYGFKG